jgi:hypothetical protein
VVAQRGAEVASTIGEAGGTLRVRIPNRYLKCE